MTTFWICSAITLLAAAFATISGDGKRSALSLWLAGMGAGGIYLSLGAELLAVVQWLVSTLVAISFLFYAIMFGEYSVSPRAKPRSVLRVALEFLLPVMVGLFFSLTIWFAMKPLAQNATPARENSEGLAALGKAVVENHLISVEILGLMLFLVLVGAGAIARPEGDDP